MLPKDRSTIGWSYIVQISGRSSRKKGTICGTVYFVSRFPVEKANLYLQAANVDNNNQFDKG